MPYNHLFALALGILPSFIWLIFYLRKDMHPEPKKWLLLIFLAGMAIAPLVTVVEWQAINFFNFLNSISPFIFNDFFKDFTTVFIAIAAIEEFFKFLVVRLALRKNPVFDEPADAMIYMIVSALGFSAIENIIVMYSYMPNIFLNPALPLIVLAFRFIGATFLHTLSSGIIGFYYALSLAKTADTNSGRSLLMIKGFTLAILLHGLFNYFIVISKESAVIYLSIPLLIIFIFISKDFKILQGISPKKFNK